MAFTALTINDGLSQGLVMRIFQDRYGFMWFATLDGLNRYDGYRFVVYRHDTRDKTSITESYVQTIFEDSKGRLWIGTFSGGLDLFDREKDSFIHLNCQQGKAFSLPSGPITSIAEDSQGNIWVTIGEKLFTITVNKSADLENAAFSIHQALSPDLSTASFVFSTTKRKLYYINATEGIVYSRNENKGDWSVRLKLSNYFRNDDKKKSSAVGIVQLIEDTVHQKINILHENGFLLYNERNGEVEKTFLASVFNNTSSYLRACLDKDGLVWFGDTKGLAFFDTRTGRMGFASLRDSSLAWMLNHGYTTYIDRSGLLWMGTGGYGVVKRNVRAEAFHHTGRKSFYIINEADNGKIVIGGSLGNSNIFDRTEDSLYVTTDIARTKSEQEYYSRFFNPPITTDAAGTWYLDSNQLCLATKEGNAKRLYGLPITVSNEYPDFIQCKIVDSSGNIWLGTMEGLLRFNIESKQWTVFQNQPADLSSLSSKRIFSLCLDPAQPKKYLWIGTDGGGLNRMDLATGKCTLYTSKNGLPNNVVYGILSDDDGNLWISTNKGLSCFTPQKQFFRNFDFEDGLQSNEFNRRSSCKTKDGCLFFGGVNGFNYFYPREMLSNKTVPQVVITGLRIRNQPISILSQGSPLSKAIYLTKDIKLPYEQNFVSFDFASLDFTNSEQNQFQYKLEGFDEDWIQSGNVNSATYTNLDPGTYTFRVKGTNNDGIWNEAGTSIQITVLPPWYMTWWFRLLALAAIATILYFIYRYRLRQALKLQAIRDGIAQDLHDEIGSNLSNISIFTEVAKEKSFEPIAVQSLLTQIADSTQTSQEAMSDIVWMINTRYDRIENIIARMRTLAADLFETGGQQLHMDFDEGLEDIKLDMAARKNFYLIYKEALNNAAKYAASNNIWIQMKLHNGNIFVSIKDDGVGFDMHKHLPGNGLINMKRRAEMLRGRLSIHSEVQNGTTISLSFPV